MSNTTNTTNNTTILEGGNNVMMEMERERINGLNISKEEKEAMLCALDAGLLTTGTIVLDTQDKVIRFMGRIVKEQVYINNLVLPEENTKGRDGKLLTNMLIAGRTDMGRLYRGCAIEPIYETWGAKISTTLTDCFTKDFLIVTANKLNKEALTNVEMYNAANGTTYGIKVKHDGLNSLVLLPRLDPTEGIYYVRWDNGKKYRQSMKKFDNYLFVDSSPSGERNNQFVCKLVNGADDRAEFLNAKGHNVFTKMCNRFKSLSVDETVRLTKSGDITKDFSRLGQIISGSVNMGPLGEWVYVQESFKCIDERTVDGETTKDLEETIDGTFYILNTRMAKILSGHFTTQYGTEIEVLPEACTGLFLQCRPGFMKGACLVVEEGFMRVMWREVKARNMKYEVYCSNGSDTEDADYVPQVLVDKNIVKANWDFEVTDFEYLAYAKKSEAHFSTQFATKLLERGFVSEAPQDAINAMAKLCRVTQDEFEAEYVSDSLYTVSVADSGYQNNILRALRPDILKWNPGMRASVLRQMTNKAKNTIEKLSLATENSFNARLISDPSGMMGSNPTLKFGELYNKAMSDEIERVRGLVLAELNKQGLRKGIGKLELQAKVNEVLEAIDSIVVFDIQQPKELQWSIPTVMIKYPSMGPEEFYYARFVSFNLCIAERVKANGNVCILNTFNKLAPGVVCLPASKDLMGMLAGLDFDFDGGSFFCDRAITRFLSTIMEYGYYKTEITR